MSLFPHCQWEACNSPAVSRCSSRTETLSLCQQHTGNFLASEEHVSAKRMLQPLTPNESESLLQGLTGLQSLAGELRTLCLKQHQESIRALESRMQAAGRILESQLSWIQTVEKSNARHLQELGSCGVLPLMSTEGIVPGLVTLKAQGGLKVDNILKELLGQFTEKTLDQPVKTLGDLIQCSQCQKLDWKTDIHEECTVCRKCLSVRTATAEAISPQCTCVSCEQEYDDTQVIKCSAGNPVCLPCWKSSYIKNGLCPSCNSEHKASESLLDFSLEGISLDSAFPQLNSLSCLICEQPKTLAFCEKTCSVCVDCWKTELSRTDKCPHCGHQQTAETKRFLCEKFGLETPEASPGNCVLCNEACVIWLCEQKCDVCIKCWEHHYCRTGKCRRCGHKQSAQTRTDLQIKFGQNFFPVLYSQMEETTQEDSPQPVIEESATNCKFCTSSDEALVNCEAGCTVCVSCWKYYYSQEQRCVCCNHLQSVQHRYRLEQQGQTSRSSQDTKDSVVDWLIAPLHD